MFDDENFNTRIRNKEGELIQILQDKISHYESRLHEKDTLLIKLDEKNSKLTSDFEFNLTVINSRDQDISTITENLSLLLTQTRTLQSTISSLESTNAALQSSTDSSLAQKCSEVRTLYTKISDLKSNLKFYKSGYLEEITSYKNSLASSEAALTLSTANHDALLLATVNAYEDKVKVLKEKSQIDREQEVLGLRGAWQETVVGLERLMGEKDGMLEKSRGQCCL